MLLDERKMRILKAIIDDYINTAEPVGSRTIAGKHGLGLSSATIRNEMSDLEEMGYLSQPHTSAGRIPSDKGYRLYVDHMIGERKLTKKEINEIQKSMDFQINELSQLIRQASSVLSRITHYTSVSMTQQAQKIVINAIQVVPIETGKVLVIIVSNSGAVSNSLVKISENVTPDFLIKLSNVLNEKLSGLSLDEINLTVIKSIEEKINTSKEILLPILKGVKECIMKIDNQEVYLEGTTNIFEYPEFTDMTRVREFLNILEEKDIIRELFSNYSDDDNTVTIQIGLENHIDAIKDFSIVRTTYSLGELLIGSIGIIGPTRMEYERVISSMNYVRKKINEEIEKMIGDNY